MIEVNNVSFTYPGQAGPVLENFSLTIHSGCFITLVGRNGSGKSTVAKLLNGLLLPSSGEVSVDGLSTRERSSLLEIRQIVQLVFQNSENQLIGGTVEEDVAFGLENLGVPWPEMGERIDWALDFCRLQRLRSRPVTGLSGGEKQRVALAGVLAMRPQYLILDEGTSMLDDEGKSGLQELLRTLNTELGMAILQITQDLDEALMGDRVLVLDRGAIVLDGASADILMTDQLSELGLLPPTIVRLGRELAQIGVSIPRSCLNLAELVDTICKSN